MIATILNSGTVRFMTDNETMTVNVLSGFFKRLIKDATRQVFLLLDYLRVHYAHWVWACLDQHSAAIEVGCHTRQQ
jgi:hypothetical protein